MNMLKVETAFHGHHCPFLPNILPKFGRLSLNLPITLCLISSALCATDDPTEMLLPMD